MLKGTLRRIGGKTRKASTKKPSKKLATVATVKKLINRTREVKLIGQVLTTQQQAFINSPGMFLPLIPALAQGDTDNQRTGNKIRPRGLRVAVTVTYGDSPVTPIASNVIYFRILALSDKKMRHIPLAIAQTDPSHLLDSGTGEHAYLARIQDYQAPVNPEAYTLHKDIRGQFTFGTSEINPRKSYTYVFNIKCPKVLDYLDNQTFPSNFAPMIVMGYSFADGTIPGTDQFTPVKMDLATTLYYDDA